MRRLFVFLLPLLLTSGLVRAQQAPSAPIIRLSPEDKDRGYNGPQKNFFFTTQQAATAEYENAGFFGQRVRPYLAGNTEALADLNRYRRQKWMFLAERAVFIGAVGVYSQQVLAGPGDQQYFNNSQKIAAGVAVFSLLSNVFIARHTNEHFLRAISSYNAGQSSARTGLLPRLAPSSIGLTAAVGRPQLALRWSLR